MKKIFKFYPDLELILVFNKEYNLNYFVEKAKTQSLEKNISSLHQLWMWKTISTPGYLFWYIIFILMFIPGLIGIIFGFSAPVVLVMMVTLVCYPIIFKMLLHDFLKQSYGYNKYLEFLEEYHQELKKMIEVQKLTE